MKLAKKINFKAALGLLLAVTVLLSTCVGMTIGTNAIISGENNGLLYFADDFERDTITGDNSGWIEQKTGDSTKNTIADGVLTLGDTSSSVVKGYGYDLVMRPMSEAALDQRVSIEINNLEVLPMTNASVNLHLRLLSNRHMITNNSNIVADQSYAVRVGYNQMHIVKVGMNQYYDAAANVLTGGNASVDISNINVNNIYKLEFVAKGSNPTILTATLYDLTEKKIVATVSGTDDTYALQLPGTAAVSMSGGGTLDKRAELDNFEYEQLAEVPYFYDTFSRDTIAGNDSGWVEQLSTGGNSIDAATGYLFVKSTNWNEYTKNLVLRSMNETAINQKASVMIANMGHTGWINGANKSTANVHVRATATSGTHIASYFAALGLNSLNIYKANSSGAVIKLGSGVSFASNLNGEHKFRLELVAEGTYPTKLTANVYSLTTNQLLYTTSVTDTTVDLQCPGTVGVSVQGSNRTANMDDFICENLDNTVKYYDDFDRTNITTDDSGNTNGWVEQVVLGGGTSANAIGTIDSSYTTSKLLRVYGGEDTANQTKNVVARSMDEAAVNQKASVTLENSGHYWSGGTGRANVHVRVNGLSKTHVTSYFASIRADGVIIYRALASADGTTVALKEIAKQAFGADLGDKAYRIELTAEGTYPTKLTARVYRIDTAAVVVEKLEAYDSTAELQRAGTVGISVTGRSGAARTGSFDNFIYEYEPEVPFVDDFESGVALENTDWVQQNASAGNIIEVQGSSSSKLSNLVVSSNVLKIKSTAANEFTKNVVLRPMSEAAVNQKASVTAYQMGHMGYNSGAEGTVTKASTANIHVRAINTSGTHIASYFASFGQGDVKGSTGHLTIYKSDLEGNITTLKSENINEKINGNIPYRLELTAEGTYPTTITATVYDIDNNNIVKTINVEDSTAELQQEGTVGLSIQGANRQSKFDDFMYETYDEAVTDVIIGDVNRDGVRDETDDAQLRNKLLGLKTTFVGNLGCDVNEDGFVDIRDLVFLSQALSGVVETPLLSNTYTKLVKENKLNVAYLGGSITAGYGASNMNKTSWRALTTAYLKESFPNATINETNAAIGGTGSSYGVYRAVTDLKLATQAPDLVFIEYGVNDKLDHIDKETVKANMEYIIRTIYDYSPNADIVIVLTTAIDLYNWYSDSHWFAAKAHDEIAKEYNLPFIKIGPMLWDFISAEIKEKGIPENEQYAYRMSYFGDGTHPSDKGYAKYAEFITDFLGEEFLKSKLIGSTGFKTPYEPENPLYTMPVAPYMDNFKDLEANISGASIDANGYLTSNTAGTSFTIKFKGTDLKIWSMSTTTSGSISVSVDGGDASVVDLYQDGTKNWIYVLATGLENTEHTVTITLNATDKGAGLDIRHFLISGEKEQSGITLVTE